MKDKKPLIKNARLRGLVIMIVAACLIVADVFAFLFFNKHANWGRGNWGEFLWTLLILLGLLLLWFVYGVVLFVSGDKTKKQSDLETLKENETTESQSAEQSLSRNYQNTDDKK